MITTMFGLKPQQVRGFKANKFLDIQQVRIVVQLWLPDVGSDSFERH